MISEEMRYQLDALFEQKELLTQEVRHAWALGEIEEWNRRMQRNKDKIEELLRNEDLPALTNSALVQFLCEKYGPEEGMRTTQ